MKAKTKLLSAVTTLAMLAALAAWAQNARQYSVKSMPPSVLKTVPAAGATDVDPNLKEITVTFSKEMTDGSWSIPTTTPKENFPDDAESGAKIHYLPDKRTCVMPVKLQPGRTYVVWFNHGQFMNFRDGQHNSAVPYLLVFETRK
jgi:RNA polymerase sigma-70 factor (ECF subfamily)